jgi:anaerobic carbon-monoxide dehydrogenase iron sulfur subunit
MIAFDVQKCVYCLNCVKVCSMRWVGQVKPTAGAIRIVRREKYGPPAAHVCDLCAGRAQLECVAVCPSDALEAADGIVRFCQEACTQCMSCVDACPQAAIAFDEPTGQIVLCDLCGRQPLCVAWCPEDALALVEVTA